METSSLDLKMAKCLLKRICKVVTDLHKTKVYPRYFSDGMANIITEDNEIVSFKVSYAPTYVLYFKDAIHLVEAMMMPETTMNFYPLCKNKVMIDTSMLFGTTLEELKINLDLMKA